MNSEIATSVDLRLKNRSNIFSAVYRLKNASKQALTQELKLSMPTVTHGLKEMETLNLIHYGGLFNSTGGRKAQMICFSPDARIALGIELLNEHARIAAVDLYGNILQESIYDHNLASDDSYFKNFCIYVNRFIENLSYPHKQLLGVMIAVQGLVSSDGTHLTYNKIYPPCHFDLSTFQQYISLPCLLVHDSEASAFAEMWTHPALRNMVYLALNRNFGGVLMLDRKIYQGKELVSSVIEHMCLSPDGPLCYCGRHGCVEAYCSANALQKQAGCTLEDFFVKIRRREPAALEIWHAFLKNLALTINNIRMLIDCDFILGGYLQPYLTPEDLTLLAQYVKEGCAFSTESFHPYKSNCGPKAASLGAALFLVHQFLQDSGFNMDTIREKDFPRKN